MKYKSRKGFAMVRLIGIKKDTPVEIREKLSIMSKKVGEFCEKLLAVGSEVVILSTCNRTEIYINSVLDSLELKERVFDILGWNKAYEVHAFCFGDEKAYRHLMELSCGFHSKILGEDQILSQIKQAYDECRNTQGATMKKIFQSAIACGREFRAVSNLYRIPVSSASIAASEANKLGAKSFMLLGFGEVGKLVYKYISSKDIDFIYIVVRNVDSVILEDNRVKVIPFEERKLHYKDVDCIISCTSAPHLVVNSEDLPQHEISIFDLAIPRDVEAKASELPNVKLYDIDMISSIDDENKKLRHDIMKKNKHIIDDYLEELYQWFCIREVVPTIKMIKESSELNFRKRFRVYKNKKKTKDLDDLVEILMKSSSNMHLNRAIEVLKEEQLEGRGEECRRIIEKIFCQK